jgi:predicted N-acetyltransferase YhbS
LTERPGDFQVDEIQADQIRKTAAFLRRSFPHAHQMTDDYLRWFYLDNPDGRTLCSDCIQNSKLVGHVALTPLVANVYGNVERGVLVNSVATDPDLVRRGLFTDLLTAGLEAATERGFTFAIAVPNSQSIGTFVKRAGFTSLGPLEARIGISRPPPPTHPVEFAFERQWSPAGLRWRLSNPGAFYHREHRGDRLVIDADSGTLGIRVELASFDRIHEAVEEESSPLESNPRSTGPLSQMPIHLYVGIDARRTWRLHASTNIPMPMRPAPLNLVMRDLTAQARKWTRESTHFRALDFDAF